MSYLLAHTLQLFYRSCQLLCNTSFAYLDLVTYLTSVENLLAVDCSDNRDVTVLNSTEHLVFACGLN